MDTKVFLSKCNCNLSDYSDKELYELLHEGNALLTNMVELDPAVPIYIDRIITILEERRG